MTTVFVDGSAAAPSDSDERVAHLVEAGHVVVLVRPLTGQTPAVPRDRFSRGPADGGDDVPKATWSATLDALPEDPPRGSWYVTADPATCRDRQPGLRTMLIGPRPDGPRPVRCDRTARDLRDAVLEILTAEVMD